MGSPLIYMLVCRKPQSRILLFISMVRAIRPSNVGIRWRTLLGERVQVDPMQKLKTWVQSCLVQMEAGWEMCLCCLFL